MLGRHAVVHFRPRWLGLLFGLLTYSSHLNVHLSTVPRANSSATPEGDVQVSESSTSERNGGPSPSNDPPMTEDVSVQRSNGAAIPTAETTRPTEAKETTQAGRCTGNPSSGDWGKCLIRRGKVGMFMPQKMHQILKKTYETCLVYLSSLKCLKCLEMLADLWLGAYFIAKDPLTFHAETLEAFFVAQTFPLWLLLIRHSPQSPLLGLPVVECSSYQKPLSC